MGITKDRGYWYFVKRVPKRFAHVDPRQKVTRALWDDLLRRIELVAGAKGGVEREAEELALLGGVDQPEVTISMALEEFFRFSEIDRQAGKSERQVKRWRQPRQRACLTSAPTSHI